MLLEHIIVMWDVTEQIFKVGPHSLEIELEDIYFMIGLSNRGAPIIMFGSRSTCRTTDSYVSYFFRAGSQKTRGKIVIKEIADCPLRTIDFTITKLAGRTCPQFISKSNMSYAVECMEPNIFN
jgi:hypothetical protein